MPGVVLINPSSGPGDLGDEVRRLFGDHTVEECDPDRFEDQVREAVAGGAAFVAVAGGDGTLRSAAEILRGGDVPLVVVPAGTRNHFAGALGIDSLEDARAAVAGEERLVDVGEVNGACFLNNSAIGVYPMMVRDREAREGRTPKAVANVLAAWEQLRRGRKIDVTLDGVTHRAWMAFVGNGAYGEGARDLIERESLDANVLDVRILRADGRLARLRVVGALLVGRLSEARAIHAVECAEVVLGVSSPTVEVALDGEVETMTPPLRYRSVPRQLRVLAPPATEG